MKKLKASGCKKALFFLLFLVLGIKSRASALPLSYIPIPRISYKNDIKLPSTGQAEVENLEFETNLGKTVRLHSKTKQPQRRMPN
jgi:hypothetical protein